VCVRVPNLFVPNYLGRTPHPSTTTTTTTPYMSKNEHTTHMEPSLVAPTYQGASLGNARIWARRMELRLDLNDNTSHQYIVTITRTSFGRHCATLGHCRVVCKFQASWVVVPLLPISRPLDPLPSPTVPLYLPSIYCECTPKMNSQNLPPTQSTHLLLKPTIGRPHL